MTTTLEKTLNLSSPLPGVDEHFYVEMEPLVTDLLDPQDFSGEEATQAKYIISNNLFLIHEYLNLGKARNIDYSHIQSFAANNKNIFRYLFKKKFKDYSLEVLDSWLEPSMDVIECAMYRPSNRYNKHTYH